MDSSNLSKKVCIFIDNSQVFCFWERTIFCTLYWAVFGCWENGWYIIGGDGRLFKTLQNPKTIVVFVGNFRSKPGYKVEVPKLYQVITHFIPKQCGFVFLKIPFTGSPCIRDALLGPSVLFIESVIVRLGCGPLIL